MPLPHDLDELDERIIAYQRRHPVAFWFRLLGAAVGTFLLAMLVKETIQMLARLLR